MDGYIDLLRDLASSVASGKGKPNENRGFIASLMLQGEEKSEVCSSVTKNKVDVDERTEPYGTSKTDDIRVDSRIYSKKFNRGSSLDQGYVERCKAVLNCGEGSQIDIPSEVEEIFLS